MLFDTHAHLDDEKFDQDREGLIESLPHRGIGRVICPGVDIKSSEKCVELAEKYEIIYAGVGVHPHEAGGVEENYIHTLESLAGREKVVAIGEIGLDYHYDFSPRDIQRERFAEQIGLASKLGLPIIVHDRESHQDVLDILKGSGDLSMGGVMHCYSGSWEMAKIFLGLGFYLSLGGALTFKNAKRPLEIAKNMPMDRLLIETDSPYMTPVPYRGKRNDPGYVSLVADKIADLRGISIEEVKRTTYENAKRLFKPA